MKLIALRHFLNSEKMTHLEEVLKGATVVKEVTVAKEATVVVVSNTEAAHMVVIEVDTVVTLEANLTEVIVVATVELSNKGQAVIQTKGLYS